MTLAASTSIVNDAHEPRNDIAAYETLAVRLESVLHEFRSLLDTDAGNFAVTLAAHDLPPEFVANYPIGKHRFVDGLTRTFENCEITFRSTTVGRVSIDLYSREIPAPVHADEDLALTGAVS